MNKLHKTKEETRLQRQKENGNNFLPVASSCCRRRPRLLKLRNVVELICTMQFMLYVCRKKVACDNRKEKSHRVNRPLHALKSPRCVYPQLPEQIFTRGYDKKNKRKARNISRCRPAVFNVENITDFSFVLSDVTMDIKRVNSCSGNCGYTHRDDYNARKGSFNA